jgi:hypothetical protein
VRKDESSRVSWTAFRGPAVGAWHGLFTAVARRRGLSTVHACLAYVAPMVDARVSAAGLTRFASDWQARRVWGPLEVARWLDSGPPIPGDIASLLRLYAYVLCAEVRYMYAVAGNLFAAYVDPTRTTAGNAAYRHSSAIAAFGGVVQRLQKEADIGSDLVALWASFLNRDLRNAIGHSDFFVDQGAGILYVVSTMMDHARGASAARRPIHRLRDVEEQAAQAHAFLEAFAGQVDRHWPRQTGLIDGI